MPLEKDGDFECADQGSAQHKHLLDQSIAKAKELLADCDCFLLAVASKVPKVKDGVEGFELKSTCLSSSDMESAKYMLVMLGSNLIGSMSKFTEVYEKGEPDAR